MPETRKLAARLAFREEGTMWNAYLALPNTMKGAQLIGSISMGAVIRNSEIKHGFMEVMKAVLAEAIEDVTGQPPDTWFTQTAPKGERGGNA